MSAVACCLTGCPETCQLRRAVNVCVDAPHHVMADGPYLDRLVDDIDAGELDPNFPDACQHFFNALGPKVRQVQLQAVSPCLVLEPFPLLDLPYHRAGDDIPWRELEFAWCIFLHKSLALVVDEVSAFAPCPFSY